MFRAAVVVVLAVGLMSAGGAMQVPTQPPPSTLTNPPGAPGITGTPQGTAILRTEEARAPTPVDLQLLIESARSVEPHIQLAAIQALGRLERRDVITDLLPYLRSGPAFTRGEAAHAIGQSMRGDPLPLDPKETQVDGVQQALIAAATATNGPMGAIARTLGRLPYRTAEQVAKTDAFLRQVLTLSSQLDRTAAVDARRWACTGVEMLARLQSKLFKVPEETLVVLRGIATASTPTVKRTEIPLRLAALQALVSAGAVDDETLRLAATDTLDPAFRRLSMVALAGAGSPILADARLDYLRTAFRDNDPTVRYEALRGYARHYLTTHGCVPVTEMLHRSARTRRASGDRRSWQLRGRRGGGEPLDR